VKKKKGLIESLMYELRKLVICIVTCIALLYICYTFEFNVSFHKKHYFKERKEFIPQIWDNITKGYKIAKKFF
jgi:hypothetical protein